ncbi:hypothetical protein HDU67_001662, partial [Dinochytrium kinnereticum]
GTATATPPSKRQTKDAPTPDAPPSSENAHATKLIHPFFASKSAATSSISWTEQGSLLIGTHQTHPPEHRKIAAFDFDDTLVTPNGTHVFSKTPDDWKLFSPKVTSKIQELAKTHRITILSNQRDLLKEEKGKKKAYPKKDIFKGKVGHLVNVLGVPVTILAAVEDDVFRKPRVGMWEEVCRMFGGDVDVEGSFYCGDAAGRNVGGLKKKKDHSDTDLKFALNVGVRFLLPEEIFLEIKEARSEIPEFGFDPKRLRGLSGVGESTEEEDAPLFTPTSRPLVAPEGTQDLILLVGPPGAGKTFFAHRHLIPKGYIHINQDKMKTKDHCLRAVKKSMLEEGKNVVVDNTNPDPQTRKDYLQIIHQLRQTHPAARVTARAFHFVASTELCEHNARYRSLTASGVHAHEGVDGGEEGERRGLIPGIAFRSFFGRFQAPEVAEGFDEVKRVRFLPDFVSEEERRRWELWH